jgi:hypothetical protein
MNACGRPPSQLPTLTEVLADPHAQDFVQSTSGMRRLDSLPDPSIALQPLPQPQPRSMPELSRQAADGPPPQAATGSASAEPGSEPLDTSGSSDDQIARAVLRDLQRHVDLMLEYRLRASLAPLLTQVADTLVRELKQELALTLRDVVKRAVNQEVLRRRPR